MRYKFWEKLTDEHLGDFLPNLAKHIIRSLSTSDEFRNFVWKRLYISYQTLASKAKMNFCLKCLVPLQVLVYIATQRFSCKSYLAYCSSSKREHKGHLPWRIWYPILNGRKFVTPTKPKVALFWLTWSYEWHGLVKEIYLII